MSKVQKRQKAVDLLKSLGFAATPSERRKLSYEELRRELRFVARARDEEYEHICEIYDRTYEWKPDFHETLMAAFDFLKAEETYRLSNLRRNRKKYPSDKLSSYPIIARKIGALKQ